MRLIILGMIALFVMHPLAGYAANLDMSGPASYQISGDRVTIEVSRIENNSSGGRSGSLKLVLWAASQPYSGSGACCDGYILGEFLVDGGDQLHANRYYSNISYTTSYTAPPAGDYSIVLLLAEYSGNEFVIRDHLNFPGGAGTGAPRTPPGSVAIEGAVSYQIRGDRLTIEAEKIANNRSGGHSGSLKLKLWAAGAPYTGSGSCCNGYLLGEFLIDGGNTLPGNHAYTGVRHTTSYTLPPDGQYSVVLVLLEYDGDKYVIRDHANFSDGLSVGPASGPGQDQSNGNDVPSTAFLGNISTRGHVAPGEERLIAGFVIDGDSPKKVAIRARATTLEQQGLSNVLADPVIELYRGQTRLSTNDDWRSDQGEALPAYLEPEGVLDAAMVRTLPPGAYTVIVSGYEGLAGRAIVSVNELGGDDSWLKNISTRGRVGHGNDRLIAGLIVDGAGRQKVVIRGLGQTLADRGVPGALLDPHLTIYAGRTVIAANDNWQDHPRATEVVAAGLAPAGPLDAAVMLDLEPGAYTAVLEGASATEGLGIVGAQIAP